MQRPVTGCVYEATSQELSSWGDKKLYNWVIPISPTISFPQFEIHICIRLSDTRMRKTSKDVVEELAGKMHRRTDVDDVVGT